MFDQKKSRSVDITKEKCPMTFVKAKLFLETLGPGEKAFIRLSGSEPLENIPKSLRESGYEILSMEQDSENPEIWTIHTQKQ